MCLDFPTGNQSDVLRSLDNDYIATNVLFAFFWAIPGYPPYERVKNDYQAS